MTHPLNLRRLLGGFVAAVFLASAGAQNNPAPAPNPGAPPPTGASAPTPATAPAPGALMPGNVNPNRFTPKYPTPYEPATPEQIKGVLDRVLVYLDGASAVKIVDRETRQAVTDLNNLPARPSFERTDFMLMSYEWGVTYNGMVTTAEVTGDKRYLDYTATRLTALAAVAAQLKKNAPPSDAAQPPGPQRMFALRSVLQPRSLDDSGAMCAGMIKAARAGVAPEALRPWIDNYLAYISTGQQRFADGTLARNRPLVNSLWLDDLYMSVPALAQAGALTGDKKYFDDAAKQILQFSQRMFVREKGLYMHAWVEGMDPHPVFHWGRANGWAVVAMTELLSVLPENHPDYAQVLAQYRAHVRGLAAVQGHAGLWHQLLDRTDSYEETSATAMFVYSIARGINRGWLDPLAYGPCASLGWNAVAKNVNAQGQVEATCVGTGVGWEPMFYMYRPTSVLAAHGYGPVLLAGAEMIALRKGKGAEASVHDGGVHFGKALSPF